MTGVLLSVHTGKVAPLGPQGVPSGFVKPARTGAVAVRPEGLEGDAQADLSVHGGPDKAVYGYAADHYPRWAAEHPPHAARFAPGVMGENLAIAGMDESTLCVGDIHRIGTALLQVCQPRQPCFKLGLRFEDPMMVRAMVQNQRSGWYYRVLEPGLLQAGDGVTLEGRPHPDFAFTRLVEIVYRRNPAPDELERMAAADGLARQWRVQAAQALRKRPATGQS
jgi:MOSC domain-containing protein YiiM